MRNGYLACVLLVAWAVVLATPARAWDAASLDVQISALEGELSFHGSAQVDSAISADKRWELGELYRQRSIEREESGAVFLASNDRGSARQQYLAVTQSVDGLPDRAMRVGNAYYTLATRLDSDAAEHQRVAWLKSAEREYTTAIGQAGDAGDVPALLNRANTRFSLARATAVADDEVDGLLTGANGDFTSAIAYLDVTDPSLAGAQVGLGDVQVGQARRPGAKDARELFEKAVANYEQAIDKYPEQGFVVQRARANNNLGSALVGLAAAETDDLEAAKENRLRAISKHVEALRWLASEDVRDMYSAARVALGRAVGGLGGLVHDGYYPATETSQRFARRVHRRLVGTPLPKASQGYLRVALAASSDAAERREVVARVWDAVIAWEDDPGTSLPMEAMQAPLLLLEHAALGVFADNPVPQAVVDDAVQGYEAVIDLMQKWTAQGASNPPALGEAYYRLGELYQMRSISLGRETTDHLDLAIKAYGQALGQQTDTPEEPATQRALGDAYLRRAMVSSKVGDWTAALDAYKKAMDAIRAIPSGERTPASSRELAATLTSAAALSLTAPDGVETGPAKWYLDEAEGLVSADSIQGRKIAIVRELDERAVSLR